MAVQKVNDDFSVPDLTSALHGIDAVVVTIKGSEIAVQKRLAEACCQAHVKRMIPADFGSCDSSSAITQELVPLYKRKTELREYLTQLAQQHADFSWTSIVGGHFFDWSLAFIHIWLEERKADVLDDGSRRASYSTLARVGEAVAQVLRKPAETKNVMLYVQSFCVSQLDIIHSFEKVTGVPWTTTQ